MLAKAGNALYKVKFNEMFYKKKTMLLGLDVCHKGTSSVVGFCASFDKDFTQYYSQFFDQQKIKEIVDKFGDLMMEALENYRLFN